MSPHQPDLFAADATPEGFRWTVELITPQAEAELIAAIAGLPFAPFEFRGFLGARRVVSFGWRYDFNKSRLGAAEPLPEFLQPLRTAAAAFAGLDPAALEHVLVTEYAAGAAIGWHRDRPEFGQVVGVSLAAPCRFRFRRRDGAGWRRAALILPPRSAYLISGPARFEWEHSIPPVERLRYSVTFRTRA
jgi:alkylated DNA repair dioxygenase AlkB